MVYRFSGFSNYEIDSHIKNRPIENVVTTTHFRKDDFLCTICERASILLGAILFHSGYLFLTSYIFAFKTNLALIDLLLNVFRSVEHTAFFIVSFHFYDTDFFCSFNCFFV